MRSILNLVMVLVAAVLLGGCTVHFKATECELDVEGGQVKSNQTYEIESVGFLDG